MDSLYNYTIYTFITAIMFIHSNKILYFKFKIKTHKDFMILNSIKIYAQ